MRSILLVGNDSALLDTRSKLLTYAGASVTTTSAGDAIDSLRHGPFDLIVFCHTVELLHSDAIMKEAFEQRATLRVLKVLPLFETSAKEDEIAADPQSLVAKVSDLVVAVSIELQTPN